MYLGMGSQIIQLKIEISTGRFHEENTLLYKISNGT